jgi:hypothetical protein
MHYIMLGLLLCSYHIFLGAAASSHRPDSSLAHMRYEPQFLPVVCGFPDNTSTLKMLLCEQTVPKRDYDSSSRLQRSFCAILLQGSTAEKRAALVEHLLQAHKMTPDWTLRSREILAYDVRDTQRHTLAKQDAQEFPEFYAPIERAKLQAAFEKTCTDDDLKDRARFEQCVNMCIGITCVEVPRLDDWSTKKTQRIHHTCIEGENLLFAAAEPTTTQSVEFKKPQFIVFNQAVRELAKTLFDRPRIQMLLRRKLYADVVTALQEEAAALASEDTPAPQLCGLLVVPHPEIAS